MTSDAPLPVYELERESTELLVLGVQVDGQSVADYETQETAYAHPGNTIRPTGTWAAPTIADDDAGHLLEPADPGLTTVWVKYQANPEVPVRRVAHIRRT